jgi:hypothetical protein
MMGGGTSGSRELGVRVTSGCAPQACCRRRTGRAGRPRNVWPPRTPPPPPRAPPPRPPPPPPRARAAPPAVIAKGGTRTCWPQAWLAATWPHAPYSSPSLPLPMTSQPLCRLTGPFKPSPSQPYSRFRASPAPCPPAAGAPPPHAPPGWPASQASPASPRQQPRKPKRRRRRPRPHRRHRRRSQP